MAAADAVAAVREAAALAADPVALAALAADPAQHGRRREAAYKRAWRRNRRSQAAGQCELFGRPPLPQRGRNAR